MSCEKASVICDQPPTSKLPIAVRIIALAFMLLGTAAIADVVASLVLHRTPSIDLGVFFAPIGIGLWRGSCLARSVAAYVIALICVALAISLPVGVILAFRAESLNEPLLTILANLVLLFVFSLAWKAIGDNETIQWFQSQPAGRKSWRPLRFSLATLLFVMVLAAVFFARFSSDEFTYHPRQVVFRSYSTTGSTVIIEYGIRRHRRDQDASVIDFVVIQSDTNGRSLKSAVTSSSRQGKDGEARLTTPDGQTIKLPSDQQLYEIKDRVMRSLPGRVTKRQLDAYLKERPPDPSIDDLLAMPASQSDGARSLRGGQK